MNQVMKSYNEWLTSPYFDEKTKEELRAIAGSPAEMEDRFYKELEFGTGGLRGLLGAGTNRLNAYTVRRATQGLANYIRSAGGEERGVAIVFDSRRRSDELALETALCLNANGIRTYMFETLRPTPELSFAIRKLHCIAGVAITASHNPAEYNGYKVYWEDGGQITPPHDKNILAEAAKVTSYEEPLTMSREEAVQKGLFHVIGSEIDEAYLEALLDLQMNREAVKEYAKDVRIVYTPLHGAGNVPVRELLKRMGFTQVFVVDEQEAPDGDFTTCESPNPENEEAWDLALKLAKEKEADIAIATDPDSDRIGLYARDEHTGEYIRFTGNMTGILLAEYVLRTKQETGTMPEHAVLAKTIVSSAMGEPLAKAFGCRLEEVLTGFKYIGEKIREYEETGSYNYVFGYEESFGCLAGTYVRDKDAQCAAVLLAELAAVCRKEGTSIADRMNALYETYGYYREGLASIKLSGKEGAEQIKETMERLRSHPVTEIGAMKVFALRDYRNGIITRGEEREEVHLPKSNVLYYELDNGWCCVRPSGTEPKIKIYFGSRASTLEEADARLETLKKALLALLKQ